MLYLSSFHTDWWRLAKRRRDRRLRSFWHHEHLSMKVEVAYNSDYTNRVTETSVRHGPTSVDEVYSLVKASITLTRADDFAKPIATTNMIRRRP